MNYLITGGCGFIGRNLVHALSLNIKNNICILDNLSVGSESDLSKVCNYRRNKPTQKWCGDGIVDLIIGDILDPEVVQAAISGADVVIHLAANTGVGPSVEDPMSDCSVNVIGTLNVLEACRLMSVARLVFASSGAPLGEQKPPLNEKMAPRPQSPYGASKLAGEGYCSAYHGCFGLETVVLRFGNVYGIGSQQKDSVIAKFIKLAQAGRPLEIYGDGKQTRDFIFVSDLVDAIIRSATKKGVGGEIFQIANAREVTILELSQLLMKVLTDFGYDAVPVLHSPIRNGDVMRNFSDTSKARRLLGWSPKVSLEEGLKRTLMTF